jgi:hypothetical protein
MSLLVYVIAESEAGASDDATDLGTGLANRPLRAVADGPLVAVVSDEPEGRPQSTPGALLEYERTIERLMDGHSILPAQFGSVLPDDEAVREMLAGRRSDLLSRLGVVRGAVEFGLRASWRGEQEVTPEDGADATSAYLQVGLELQGRAREVAMALDPLADLARSSRRALLPRPDIPVLDAYLVDRSRGDEFVALVRHLDDRLVQAYLACSGPWPPYSFSDAAPLPAAGAAAARYSSAKLDLPLTYRLLRD